MMCINQMVPHFYLDTDATIGLFPSYQLAGSRYAHCSPSNFAKTDASTSVGVGDEDINKVRVVIQSFWKSCPMFGGLVS